MNVWIYISAASLLFVGDAAAQSRTKPAETVIVSQRINARYDIPGTAAVAVDKALPAQIIVAPNDSLSSVVARLYQVGPHSAGAAVAPLAGWIRDVNRLSTNDKLSAGQTLIVPDVPKLAATRPSTSNPNDQVAKLSVDLRTTASEANPLRPDLDRQTHDAFRKGASVVVSIRKLTEAEAATALGKDPSLSLVSAPLRVKFLSDKTIPATVLKPVEVNAIKAAGGKPPLQHPLLLVFDDSWPSFTEEERSRAYLLSELKAIRAELKIQPMTPFKPQCALDVRLSTWPKSRESHAGEIAAAISPLQAAAGPSSPVNVVYMPLLNEGPCADEVIAQVVEFQLIAQHMGDQLGKVPSPKDITLSYHKLALDVTGRLGASSGDGRGYTDVEVIQGLFEFSRRLGAHLHQPTFVSMSWDFPLDRYNPAIPSEFGGLFVVAAGNEGDDGSGHALPPVAQTKMQFAARSLHPGDMLAVMNIDSSGELTCHSSLVDPSGLAFATSYIGDLDSDDCGTSFSTPRVAWLLALRTAGQPPPPDLTNLASLIKRDLANGLNGPALQTGVNRLDLVKLLGEPTNPPAPASQ